MGLETPTRIDPSTYPLGGPGDPPARPLNFPLDVGLETCNACWDTTPKDLLQGMLGITDTCKHNLAPTSLRAVMINTLLIGWICSILKYALFYASLFDAADEKGSS